MNRRNFCKNTIFALAGMSLSLPRAATATLLPEASRELSFFNTHTRELSERVIYWSQGVYLSDGLEEIDYILRDHRSEEISPIDHNLLDTLYLVSRKLECQEPLHVISGYRSATTNAQLRRDSGGVAKRSLHMQGRAIDIRMPGCALEHLQRTAIDLRRGGVGFYPDSDFVHLDTGSHRTWQG